MRWNRIPPVLLVGLVATIVFETVRVAYYVHTRADVGYAWQLFEEGVGVAARVMIAAGALELGRRLPRRAAAGAWVVLGAQVAQLAIELGWIALAYLARTNHDLDAFTWMRYLDYAGSFAILAAAIGFGLLSRQTAFAIGLAVVAIVGVPIPPIGDVIYPSDASVTTQILLRFSPFVILPVGFLVAAAFASTNLADAPVAPADRPFEQLARALWLRVIAACSLAAVTVAVAGTTNDGGLLRLASVAAPVIDVLALGAAARAAIGLARTDVARWHGLAAACGFLWCLGVTAARLPAIYASAYPHDGASFMSMFEDGVPIARAWATTVPLVASSSIALVLVAIVQLSRKKGLDELRENASVRTGVFVALALGALFITRYGVERVLEGRAIGPVMVAVVAAAGASIYALAIAARLCAQAAQVIAAEPAGLPAAKLVKGPR